MTKVLPATTPVRQITASFDPHLWTDLEQCFSSFHWEFCFTLDAFYAGPSIDRPRSFSLQGEGLSMPWPGERVFVALPPGTNAEPWLHKALVESTDNGAFVVCVTVASPDADWWTWWASKASEIRFPLGRIKFQSSEEAPAWPVAILVFRPGLPGRTPLS